MAVAPKDDQPRPPGIPATWKQASFIHCWMYRKANYCVLGYVVRYQHDQKKYLIPFFNHEAAVVVVVVPHLAAGRGDLAELVRVGVGIGRGVAVVVVHRDDVAGRVVGVGEGVAVVVGDRDGFTRVVVGAGKNDFFTATPSESSILYGSLAI